MRHVVLDGDRVVARAGTLEAAHRVTRRVDTAGAVLDVRRWQGLSKGRRTSDFDPKQLRRGTLVELEHTRSRRVAERIAMDHLTEDKRYYVKLARMERNRAGMTDGDVLDAVAGAKKTLKIGETKARRKFEQEKQRALAFFDSDDVGRAARHNAIRRAEVLLSSELSRAQDVYSNRLEEIRQQAGEWGDLVPVPRRGESNRAGVDPADPVDRSTHPTVVEYAAREMLKGKSPAIAAGLTVKKLSGFENMFFGPGTTIIEASALEQALWSRLADLVIEAIPKIRPGKEHFALDGVISQFRQTPAVRARLKQIVVEKLGRDPFAQDDSPNRAGDDPVDRLGPMPRGISFDPRCFERLGTRVYWIAGKGGAPAAYERRFYDEESANEYQRTTGRAITRREEPITRRIGWTLEECEDARMDRNRVGDLAPPNRPRDASMISFDPRCFEQVGTKVYWLGGGGGGRYPHRFDDEASASEYHRRTGRAVTRHEEPIVRRIAWTLADCPP